MFIRVNWNLADFYEIANQLSHSEELEKCTCKIFGSYLISYIVSLRYQKSKKKRLRFCAKGTSLVFKKDNAVTCSVLCAWSTLSCKVSTLLLPGISKCPGIPCRIMLTKKVIICPIGWWSFYLYQCYFQRLQYRHCIYKDNKLLFISHFVSMYQTHLKEFSKADFFICSVWKIYLSSVFCISWLCHWWLTCRLNKHPVIRVSVNCSEGCVHKVKWVGLLLPNIFY